MKPRASIGVTALLVTALTLSACAAPTNNAAAPQATESASKGVSDGLITKGGVDLPESIKKLIVDQRAEVKNLAKKEAKSAFTNNVQKAIVEKFGETVAKGLGAALGPLAGYVAAFVFDQVFGVAQRGPSEKEQIISAIDSMREEMNTRFDEVDSQLIALNNKADTIITGQAQANFDTAYRTLKQGLVPRVNKTLSTQRKMSELLSKDTLSPAQTTELKKLVNDFRKQSADVVSDLPDWEADLLGSAEGLETANLGVISAYQRLAVQQRRFISVYEYQAMKAQALAWQASAVVAAEVALDRVRTDVALDVPDDQRDVLKFVGEGGSLDRIADAVPKLDWAPTSADGKEDPNAQYLLDSQTGFVVLPGQVVVAKPAYTYVQRQLKCAQISPQCNRGRNPKWKPTAGEWKTGLPDNFNNTIRDPAKPVVQAGSLLPEEASAGARPLGAATPDDRRLLSTWEPDDTVDRYFASYSPTGTPPVTGVTLVHGSIGKVTSDEYDEDVGDRDASWASKYYESIFSRSPQTRGVSTPISTFAYYPSRPCGSTSGRTSAFGHWVYTTKSPCKTSANQVPKKTSRTSQSIFGGTVVWYDPVRWADVPADARPHLIGVSALAN